MKKAVIAGGSGKIGRCLIHELKRCGYEVVVLTRGGRQVDGADRIAGWNGKDLGDWTAELEGADAVVNLSGSPVSVPWNEKNRKEIRQSRVQPTELVGKAISQCKNPPKAWLNASATGWYGDTGKRQVTEAHEAGEGFLAETCEAWERAVYEFSSDDTRKIIVRIGVVLGKNSPAFNTFAKATKMFAGSAFGSGKQYMSWIHADDLVRMMVWALENDFSGVINGTSPEAQTQNDFMSAFRDAFGRPPVPNVPKPLVPLVAQVAGVDPEFLLTGTNAYPAIALARGFKYEFPTLKSALDNLVNSIPEAWKE